MTRTPLGVPTNEVERVVAERVSGSDSHDGFEQLATVALGFRSEFVVYRVAVFRALFAQEFKGSSPNVLCPALQLSDYLSGEGRILEARTPVQQPWIGRSHCHDIVNRNSL